ncbi:hypothetical protein D3C76_1104190 [compost metagenome]
MLIGPFKRRATHRLRQQIVTEGRSELALGLAVKHRHVLIPLGRQLQLAVSIEFAHREMTQTLIPYTLFECGALGTADPLGVEVRLGTMQ